MDARSAHLQRSRVAGQVLVAQRRDVIQHRRQQPPQLVQVPVAAQLLRRVGFMLCGSLIKIRFIRLPRTNGRLGSSVDRIACTGLPHHHSHCLYREHEWARDERQAVDT